MKVTVTLKDAQSNPVTGQAALLTADTVTVPGATLAGGWKDEGDGVYSAAYKADKAGTDLKASLKLKGWAGSADSAVYTITHGAAVPDLSVIMIQDGPSFAVDSDMTVQVVLNDFNDNPVTGQAALLTADTVTVPGATLTGSWKDEGEGVYSAAYKADKAGTGLKATLKLKDWAGSAVSAEYAITLPSDLKSILKVSDGPHFLSKDVTLTAHLMDAGGQVVGGDVGQGLLNDAKVTLPGQPDIHQLVWAKSNITKGEYTAKYTPESLVSQEESATLQLKIWENKVKSVPYSVVPEIVPEILSVKNNSFTFNPDEPEHFPSTAFKGATFTIVLNHPAKSFTWKSNQPDSVEVDPDTGSVLFKNKPSSPVIITITAPGGISVNYSFEVTKWFFAINGEFSVENPTNEADDPVVYACAEGLDRSGATPAMGEQMWRHPTTANKGVGFLFDEWGDGR
ncbi:hypothetical protein ACTVNI_25870, partial [Serratia bockelmannii]